MSASKGISKYLDERLVVFLDEGSREDVILRLVDLLHKEGKLQNKEKFLSAILEREKIVSTGIGIGVAIPHAKMSENADFFIAIGIQKKRGIDWKSLDGSLVHLIFMIGGPDNKQTEYLKILSNLTQSIKDEQRRKRLLKCNIAKEVIELFTGC
ncbi:MAG: PTS sugar transporter subunit IIA [Verrucomicrobia bacterium]|nr:PTS sugar transporter subunit IIA [Verrucomicrobiota bacterium]